MVSAAEIQHTRLKGELVFQGFCLKLIRRYWKDDYAEAHGRSGQRQHGADITGRDYRNDYRHAAVQCKASETDDPRQISEDELVEEVKKAKGYRPKLDILIVAYGGDRDAVLQRKAQEISAENEREGLFRVVVWSWDDIIARALDFPDVVQELLVYNQVPATTALDPKRPKHEALQTFESTVQTALTALHASIAEEPAKTGDPVLDGKLDVFRDQLRAGNGQMLVQTLRDFVQNLPDDVHPHVRFRAYANLGSALAQADNLEGAAIAFDSAADAEPGTADSHTYKARAAFLRGDREKAFAEAQTAMSIAPDQFAATIFLEAAPDTEQRQALEASVAGFSDEKGVASSLIRLYAAKDKHAEAIRVARAIAKDDWQKDGAVGQALLGEFESDTALKIGAPLTPTQQAQIDEARVRLESAWTAARTRGDWKNWTFFPANLCSAYRLLGRDEDADKLALEVFALDPKAPSMAQRAALAYVRRSDLENAQKAIDSIAVDSSAASDDLLLACTIAASRKDWPEASRLAEKAFQNATSNEDKARAAELRVEVKFRSGTPKEALALAASLRGTFEPTIGFESRVAEIARRFGDADETELARKRLEAFGPSERLDALERFELADAYADDGEWSKAADLLEGLHALDRPSEILKRRLFALYRADRRADSRALYESLKPEALKSSELLRLGAAIYERSGMLKEALDALTKAIKYDEKDLRSRLDWVLLNIRNGTEDPVRRWAKKVEAPSDGDPEDLMELAQILDRYGHRKQAIAIGYRTLQEHWGESERLHMMYMSLFLLHSRAEGFLRPKAVMEDSVAFLQNEHGSRRDYKIERTDKPGTDVLAPDHPFASQLTGKKAGEMVGPDSGIGQATAWTIVEIKHKYLDLLHRAMEAHATLFPNSRSLGQYHFDATREDSLEPMFEQARARARVVEEAIRLYTTNPMPIDGIAKMLGVDAIDASRGLRFSSGLIFDVCIGAHEERELALKALAESQSFLVDVVTLAIWEEIGLLPELERLALRPKVVQATIDALVQRVDEAQRNVSSNGGSLEARGDRIVFIEIPKAERQEFADSW